MSLRWKLTLVLLLMSALPFMTIGFFAYSDFRQSLPDSALQKLNETLPGMLFFVGTLLVMFILFLTQVLATIITSPLSRLVAVMQRIRDGNFSVRADTRGKDEITTLAVGLNALVDDLQSANSNLERRVAGQTQILNEKIRELEQINKALIGRELRMADLKQELSSLKKRTSP